MNEWQSIETAPFNTEVFLCYKKASRAERVVIKAIKHQAFRIEHDDEYAADWCDYDDESGNYYLPEGWYGCVENDSECVFLNVPNHLTVTGWWMHLPELPKDKE